MKWYRNLKWYLILLSLLLAISYFIFKEYFPRIVVGFGVLTIPLYAIIHLYMIHKLSVMVYDKFPDIYQQMKTVTLGGRDRLIASYSLIHTKNEKLLADDILMNKVKILKKIDNLMYLSFLIFVIGALLSVVRTWC